MHTYIHTYIHACMHAYIHAYIHTYIHVLYIVYCIWYIVYCTILYVVYISMYISIHIYIYIYIERERYTHVSKRNTYIYMNHIRRQLLNPGPDRLHQELRQVLCELRDEASRLELAARDVCRPQLLFWQQE